MAIWVGKILGPLPTASAWVQIHDYQPPDEALLGKRGRLIAVVGLTSVAENTQFDPVAQGREALARLNELYYGETATPALAKLKQAILQIKEEFNNEQDHLEITGLALFPDVAYVVRLNGGVWAQVGGREGWVVSPQSTEVAALTGQIRPGLSLVLGNTIFWQGVPLGMIKAGLSGERPEQILETVGMMTHGNAQLVGAAAVVVKFPEPEPVAKPVPTTAAVKPVTKPAFKLQLPKWWPKAPQVYVVTDRTKPQRWPMYIGLTFLLLLLGIVIAGRYRHQQLALHTGEINTQLNDLLSKYREAEALAPLNPARSRQLLQEVQTGLASLPKSAAQAKDSRLTEIQTGLPQVLGVATGTKTPAVTDVLDLTLVRPGMTGQILRLGDQGLMVLDTQGSRLVTIDPTKNSGNVLFGAADLGQVRTLATYPGKTEVLSDKGVVECTSQCATVIKPEDKINPVIDVGMFAGNIYILSTHQVWRYSTLDNGFSTAQSWLADSENPDFSAATNMAIDGSIWVASGNQILKYTRGVTDNFTPQDVDQGFGSKIYLYTDGDSDKLYVLDPDHSRIVVLVKQTGEYDSQYEIKNLQSVTSFAVDEKAGFIYWLAGSKVESVKL